MGHKFFFFLDYVFNRFVMETCRLNLNMRLIWKVVRVHYVYVMYGLSLGRHKHLEMLQVQFSRQLGTICSFLGAC